ncbi:hypothetical protein D3C85_1644480 [compost metagenome]
MQVAPLVTNNGNAERLAARQVEVEGAEAGWRCGGQAADQAAICELWQLQAVHHREQLRAVVLDRRGAHDELAI